MDQSSRTLTQVALAGALTFLTVAAHATPVVSGAFHFRDQRTANSVGFFIGDRLTYGLTRVTPSGLSTTVTGTNPEYDGVRDLVFFPSDAFPNQYAGSVAYDPDIADNAWTLTADDGVGPARVIRTPIPGSAATVTPFIESFSLSNPGATPTFNWTVPDDSTHTRQTIRIFDLEDALASTGEAPIILSKTLSATAESFTVGAGDLESDHNYSIAVQLDDTSGGALRSRSRSFFDFSTGEIVVSGEGPVFLPSVNPERNPSGGPVYEFNVGEVVAGETIFIDPFVAIGYAYEKGALDENFATVELPDIGDGVFTLSYFDGTNSVVETLLADTEFIFPSGGVSAFTVEGIETSAGLDPNDAAAFATGISFVANSRFTGTMTPITVFIQSVPAPTTTTLLALGLFGAGFIKKRWTH